MPSYRDHIAARVWQGLNPFEDDSTGNAPSDFQGWASNNPFLARAINETSPKVVVEVGVWKGGSVITLAQEMKRLGLDGVVIAVDTWCGSSEHWVTPEWFPHLRIKAGHPTLYQTFASNIREKLLTDLVVPLPLDSLNAAAVIASLGITIDVMHLDGGHDFESVSADLRAWWPLIRPGGILIGDDYHSDGNTWPDVRRAFHAFFSVDSLEGFQGKCYVRKHRNDKL